MSYISDYFDLSSWKVTLPVDASGTTGGLALDVFNLYQYESTYFYDASDGAMVFRAMVDGATTGSTKYARCELREMNGTSLAAWTLGTGGTMTATLKVDSVPKLFDGTVGKFIVGQIHGKSDELVRLYWENNKLFFRNDQSGPNNTENSFNFKNASGQEPNVAIGETFSYLIDARGSTLTVKIFADGQEYKSVTTINSIWQSDTLYFKAGVYLGVNEEQGTGVGQASFYGLDFSHVAGEGMDGLDPALMMPTPPIPQPIGTSGNDVILGTPDGNTIFSGAGDDDVSGRDGNDILYGEGGNDVLDGGWDDDTLYGGAGNDVLTGNQGRDTFMIVKGDQGATITDFTVDPSNGDRAIVKGFTSAELASAVLTTSGSNVIMMLPDGSQVTFQNVTKSALTASNLLAEVNGVLTGLMQAGATPTPTPTTTLGTISGTSGDDIIWATHDNNVVMGGAGNDKIYGRDGDDIVSGEDGNDIIDGGWNNDTLYGGNGADILTGGYGDDILDGGAGNDTATGGAGADVFILAKGDAGMTVTDFNGDRVVVKGYTSAELATTMLAQVGSGIVLTLGDGAQMTFQGLTIGNLTPANLLAEVNGSLTGLMPLASPAPVPEPTPAPEPTPTHAGTSGDDVIWATHSNNVVVAGVGNDKVYGRDGDDIVYGQDGNDLLDGGWDNDTLYGGNGTDKLQGGNGNDALYGEAGNDTLSGDAGNDKLYGGIGNDFLTGLGGDDILSGGAGQDRLTGGAGKDIFVFTDIDISDVLTDFNPLADKLDLGAFLATGGTASIASISGKVGVYVDVDGAAQPILIATFEGTSVVPFNLADILL